MENLEGHLIEDWVDYNKSIIHSISSQYYVKKGIDAFDNFNASETVPNTVTSSYPHALSLAKILFTNIQEKKNKKKFRVLECGSGSGMFARYFLMAIQELGFLDKVEFFLSDISSLSLLQIRQRGILKDFQEGVHYHFIQLTLPDFDSASDIEGNPVCLEDLEMVIANYVLDVLPMLPLKIKENGKFEKLQLKIVGDHGLGELDLLSHTQFLSQVKIEEKWESYDLLQASPLERKYFEIFQESNYNKPLGFNAKYNYLALAVIDNVMARLNDDGLFYILDIPAKLENQSRNYIIFANSIANFLNEPLFLYFAHSLKIPVLVEKDHLFTRLLFIKTRALNTNLEFAFDNEFKKTNNMNLYYELIQLINIVKSPQSVEVLRFLVHKLQEIDGKSALSITSQGLYCEVMQDYKSALSCYYKAQAIDFFNECLLDTKITRVNSILKQKTTYQII